MDQIPSSPSAQPQGHSYLERLQFDPKLARGVIAKYITNIRLVVLLVITIVLMGILAYTQLPKRLNPEVKIPIVTVVTVIPGAGPTDVEKLVTIPLEDQLRGLKGIDTITSASQDNVSFITMQFLSSVDRDKAKDQVQSSVDSVTSLPSNAQTPKVTALDFEDQPIWQFALTSKKSYPDLMNFANKLKNQIDNLPNVDRVLTTGYDQQEVVVEISPEKLAEFGLNPLQLSQAIQKARASYPAGSLDSTHNTFSLTIDPQLENIDDIRNLKIQVQGRTLSLSDVATVALRSKPDQQVTLIANQNLAPTPAVTFYVYKSTDANIDSTGKEVKDLIDAQLKAQNGDYQLTTILNTSDEINKQFTDLLHEFRSTIILVFVCLFLFLGIRQAIISSATVPLTFLSAFVFMLITGMTINFLSLFAFLLALGLIVDDTIVTVSAMTTYFRTGRFSPSQTGMLVWKDTIVPIWSTTITTIWSFVPLLITSGIIGEFIKPIPIVVTVTMLSSTAIAVLVTLPMMIVILKPRIPHRVLVLLQILLLVAAIAIGALLLKSNPLFPLLMIVYLGLIFLTYALRGAFQRRSTQVYQTKLSTSNRFIRVTEPFKTRVLPFIQKYSDRGMINVEPFAQWYKRTISQILANKGSRRKVLIAVAAYAIFCFALLPLGFVKNEFFPKSDQNEIQLSLELPAGTTLEQTQIETNQILPTLIKVPENEFVIAEIGKSAGQQTDFNSSSNQAVFTIRLKDKDDRKISSITIADQLRQEFASYSKGKISVLEESGGPPAGSDLQIKLLGPDLEVLDENANKLSDYLKQQPGVTNVEKSISSGTSKLVFVPDDVKLADNGLTPDSLAFSLRLYASGFPLDSIAFDPGSTDKTDVTMRLQKGSGTPEGLSQFSVLNPKGQTIPILALGQLQVKPSPTQITREDGQRTISVTAAVTTGHSITDANQALEKYADSLHLPPGYSWKTGGVNDENTKSVTSILQAMIVSAILILITMVIQFGSFRQALIVLLVIPLAVSSVFLAFALTGTPLSFPAMIGVLSLFGIVVTNSMFIVDKINLNRRQGLPFREAIADAGASRMEPIILTKLCTVFGLLPITLADPLWRGLGGAIISGLLIASTIMLLVIPVLYYDWIGDTSKSN